MESNNSIELDNNDEDIDISGMICAERKGAPNIVTVIKELIHNSLEKIRTASVKGNIKIILRLEDGYINEIIIVDTSPHSTGITNLKSKNIYKLYHHQGDSTGFSEYGIGATIETLRTCSTIEHHTITSCAIYETTRWNVNKSININHIKRAIEYEESPHYKPLEEHLHASGHTTGTMVICKDITVRRNHKSRSS